MLNACGGLAGRANVDILTENGLPETTKRAGLEVQARFLCCYMWLADDRFSGCFVVVFDLYCERAQKSPRNCYGGFLLYANEIQWSV